MGFSINGNNAKKGKPMANRYDSFAVFMAEVVQETKQRVVNPERFGSAWNATGNVLNSIGWAGFLVICGLLALGAIAFGVALPAFLLTPVGVLVVVLGGGALMWTLWRNKRLPLAVKQVGEEFKPRYDAAEGRRAVIDGLKEEAVNALFRKLLSL